MVWFDMNIADVKGVTYFLQQSCIYQWISPKRAEIAGSTGNEEGGDFLSVRDISNSAHMYRKTMRNSLKENIAVFSILAHLF